MIPGVSYHGGHPPGGHGGLGGHGHLGHGRGGVGCGVGGHGGQMASPPHGLRGPVAIHEPVYHGPVLT